MTEAEALSSLTGAGLQELSVEHTGAGRWTGQARFRTDAAPLSTCHAEVETTSAAVLARWLVFVQQSAQPQEGGC